MAKNLQVREQTDIYLPGPADDARTDMILRRALSGHYREYGTLMMFNAPSAEERQALGARLGALLASIKFEKNKVRLLLMDMLEGYRSRGVRPTESAATVVDVYVRELALEPAVAPWAVWRACAAIRTWNDPKRLEEHGIRIYEAPTTMALRRLCDSFLWATRAEMVNIGAVLSGRQAGPETSPEVREALAKRMREFADDMRARLKPDNLDMPAPISEEKMIEMAGGDDGWSMIPDRKVYGKSKQMAEYAAKIAADLAPQSS